MMQITDGMAWILSGLMMAGAVYAVITRNLVRAIFGILGSLTAIALLYLFLSADFLAVTQMLVYVGGVMVLFLFAVFSTGNLSDPTQSLRRRIFRKAKSSSSQEADDVADSGIKAYHLLALALMAAFLFGITATLFDEGMLPERSVPITALLGEALVSRFLLSFEVLAILLLLAIIGVFVVMREATWRRPVAQTPSEQDGEQGGAA